MRSPEREGAIGALSNSIMYLDLALKREGVQDRKKEITEEIARAIDLYEAQKDYLKIQRKPILVERISSCITLLQHMSYKNKIDQGGVQMIIKVLRSLEKEVSLGDD